MASSQAIDAMNRILQRLYRSLPVYLAQARPWLEPGDDTADALEAIAADQLRLARRVVEAIQAEGGQPDLGRFSSQFPGLNDTGMDYLLEQAIARQKHDVAAIDALIDELADAPRLRLLAEEVQGNAKGHLDNLLELAEKATGRKATR